MCYQSKDKPADIYLLNVDNGNTRMCETYPQLTTTSLMSVFDNLHTWSTYARLSYRHVRLIVFVRRWLRARFSVSSRLYYFLVWSDLNSTTMKRTLTTNSDKKDHTKGKKQKQKTKLDMENFRMTDVYYYDD